MPKIEFRGQTYNNEFEMPYDVRQAYLKEKEQRERSTTSEKPLTDIVDMSPEVKKIYERAMDNVEDKLPSSRQSKNLPKTEDIYRPSQPLIDPQKSVIEPESAFGVNRFVSSIVWAFILVAVAFIILQFLR